ncbi:MAG: transporter suffix domain-containing protein [Proteobacteria bacterium]|jgi:hypothetical protein|nr:transporter suffix domain-containing protein [Pseudomonadota bacterium]
MTQNNLSAQPGPPRWRFRVGGAVFIVGFCTPLLIPIVTSSTLSTEWKAAISGLMLVGVPELFTLVAIAILGKSGFAYLKERLFSLTKKFGPPAMVSRTRYRIGLALFLIPILTGWLLPYISHMIPGYAEHRYFLLICGDLMFVLSLFVLGGEFWDKIRALFLYDAKAHFPGQ